MQVTHPLAIPLVQVPQVLKQDKQVPVPSMYLFVAVHLHDVGVIVADSVASALQVKQLVEVPPLQVAHDVWQNLHP